MPCSTLAPHRLLQHGRAPLHGLPFLQGTSPGSTMVSPQAAGSPGPEAPPAASCPDPGAAGLFLTLFFLTAVQPLLFFRYISPEVPSVPLLGPGLPCGGAAGAGLSSQRPAGPLLCLGTGPQHTRLSQLTHFGLKILKNAIP